MISRPIAGSCPGARNVRPTGVCYSVSVPEGSRLHWGPHIAVVASPERFTTAPAGVKADLEGQGAAFTFRVCTSREGLHFTVWRGAPLTGPRVWHRYYELGYELQESCEPEDTGR